jgi:hypothetical protein
MKIVAQDRPLSVLRHRAERRRHAHPEMASRRLSTRARETGKGIAHLQCDSR